MAVLSGQRGSVTFASGYDLKIDSWEITFSSVEQDITGFEDVDTGVIWRSFIGGVREWRGTYSGKLDFDESPIASLGGSGASATFEVDNISTATTNITGTIVITEASPSVTIGSAQTVSFTFVGSGAPTLNLSGS